MGRVVAIDPGTVRIGIAVSDPLGLTAQPQASIAADEALVEIARLVDEVGADLVLVGLPVSLDGSEGPAAARSREFAEEVRSALEVPVELVDERFSSTIAERAMIEAGSSRAERREARDRVAAAVFLQSYLDGNR